MRGTRGRRRRAGPLGIGPCDGGRPGRGTTATTVPWKLSSAFSSASDESVSRLSVGSSSSSRLCPSSSSISTSSRAFAPPLRRSYVRRGASARPYRASAPMAACMSLRRARTMSSTRRPEKSERNCSCVNSPAETRGPTRSCPLSVGRAPASIWMSALARPVRDRSRRCARRSESLLRTASRGRRSRPIEGQAPAARNRRPGFARRWTGRSPVRAASRRLGTGEHRDSMASARLAQSGA
jgi:hypothetical protein